MADAYLDWQERVAMAIPTNLSSVRQLVRGERDALEHEGQLFHHQRAVCHGPRQVQ